MHYNIIPNTFNKYYLTKINNIHNFKLLIHHSVRIIKRKIVPFTRFNTVKNIKSMDMLMEYF